MTATLPRFINPASVEVGNVVAVTTTRGDVVETARATVDRIIRTSSTVTFISPEGNAFGVFRYGSKVRVTLLAVGAKYDPEPLFADLESLV